MLRRGELVLFSIIAVVNGFNVGQTKVFNGGRTAASAVTMHVDVGPSLLEQIPGLLAENMFGSVFLAGMSIAVAGIGTTIFAAFIVNGRYDEIERSMFEEQDRALMQKPKVDEAEIKDVRDFFGDVNPTVADSPKASGSQEETEMKR